jgi:hypothetical protein
LGCFLPWCIWKFIHKKISSGGSGARSTEFWLVKNSEQSGFKLVLRIYLPPRQRAMPKNGAALWIQVEKKHLNLI